MPLDAITTTHTNPAMARAEAMFAAAGRADRIACEVASLSQPWFRDLLRAAIRAYRAAEGRG